MKWEILHKKSGDAKEIAGVLLNNRGIKTPKQKKEFLNPISPDKIKIKDLGVSSTSLKKAVKRIQKAKKNKESVIVYGDYDADGITATAIMWETLHSLGLDVLPHIPDRFEEGYGINALSVENLKSKTPNLKLIVTVDNGIVAHEGIKKAKELGIDVIITDHHQRGKTSPGSFATIYTDKISGSGVAWIFARELCKLFHLSLISSRSKLELAAIGTIADQMPLVGFNRSIVKFGLADLARTKRPGLLALFRQSGLIGGKPVGQIGTYEVNYVIAPRINAMGRLKNGIDSLRLLCTTKKDKADGLSRILGRTNLERQKIVDDVVVLARSSVSDQKVIVVAGENYHEGVIGLAAGKLVEEFYRPAIVFSKKEGISKASARSISGFNIIEAIRLLPDFLIEGGGHPMAAGFSIETSKIETFAKEINKVADKLLTADILEKKLKIDCKINFDQIDYNLYDSLKQFEPFGLGNPAPTFMTEDVEVLDARTVGRESKHLKLRLKQNGYIFDSILFGGGEIYSKLTRNTKIDIVYLVEENAWNGNKSLQLKIKDVRVEN
jgi:single-stranded-DNA-specific exonuclease